MTRADPGERPGLEEILEHEWVRQGERAGDAEVREEIRKRWEGIGEKGVREKTERKEEGRDEEEYEERREGWREEVRQIGERVRRKRKEGDKLVFSCEE